METDDLLMRQVRNGDASKLAALFERHQVALYGYYVRMTGDRQASEDLVQEVFFRMLKYRHTYRDSGQFRSWMYHIARNVQADYARKRRLEVGFEEEEWNRVAGPANPGTAAERRQESALVRRALARLPEEKREVLVLSRFQDLKYEEIAEMLDCDVGAVKVRVHRALRSLREAYEGLAGRKAS
jgi:RNA polymerase sigma-70 factor (ECF subfamily)